MAKQIPNLTRKLALTLEIEPEQILRYQKYPNGYSVILKDYRKFTAVQPATDEQLAATELPPPSYPDGLPEELQSVYDDPRNFTLKKIRPLAKFLGIDDAGSLPKAGLVDEIECYKEGESPYTNE